MRGFKFNKTDALKGYCCKKDPKLFTRRENKICLNVSLIGCFC